MFGRYQASLIRLSCQSIAVLLVALMPLFVSNVAVMAQDDTDMEDEYGMQGDDYEMEMDQDYEGGMDQEYGSMNGGSRSGGGGNPQQAVLQAYQSSLSTMLASMDLSPLSAPAESLGLSIEAGPELGREAETAYQSGNYPAAMQLHYAHMVTEYDQAHTQLKTVKYSKLLRRPVWQIRWGVSFAVRGEATDPSPILEGKTPMGGRGQSEFDEMGMDQGMSMDEEMEADSQSREEEMSMDMEMGMDMDMEGSDRGRGRSSAISAPAQVTRTMLSEDAKSQLEKNLGLVAQVVQEEFSKRYSQGDFGPALCTVNAAPAVSDEANAAPAAPAAALSMSVTSLKGPVDDLLAQSPEALPLWIPGVMFLGPGESRAMLSTAKLEKIDLLIHFDVILKTNRTQQTQNVSRCRLLNVSTGKPLASSKSMDSTEVANLVRAGRTGERAYVEDQLSALFTVIDTNVKTSEMPKLTADVAKRRVGSLLSAGPADRLLALAEVRLYQAQGLLTPEDVEVAFEILGGQDGLAILHGPQEKKLSIAHEWTLQALGATAK